MGRAKILVDFMVLDSLLFGGRAEILYIDQAFSGQICLTIESEELPKTTKNQFPPRYRAILENNVFKNFESIQS